MKLVADLVRECVARKFYVADLRALVEEDTVEPRGGDGRVGTELTTVRDRGAVEGDAMTIRGVVALVDRKKRARRDGGVT